MTIRLLLSLSWIGAVAAYAWGWHAWPRLPLDSGNDAATRAAYDQIVATHAGYFALIALAPPILAWIAAWLLARK